ncbi:MAG TPA: LEA type 2 family protein [Steroidobacteraceae bacterium]|nr:LEA type 2 family protein [Steroidobacteraceae bacterium]
MKALKLLSAIFFPLLVVACVTTKLQTPHLAIISASMVSADVFSQKFNVRVHVQNPNARTLPIKKIEYKLFLEGDSFAEGQSDAAFAVPANGETEFDLAVNTNFVSSIGRLLSRLSGTDRREIQYNFEGTVIVDLPFNPKIKFNEVGTVDLSRR